MDLADHISLHFDLGPKFCPVCDAPPAPDECFRRKHVRDEHVTNFKNTNKYK